MSIVEISNSEYLELLLGTTPENRDLQWCLKTKMQIRKMQSLTGYNLEFIQRLVDSRFQELQTMHENI